MHLMIRLLGTVELSVNGRIVIPAPAKRHAMLAGLAVEAGRPVSLSRLARMVWSEEPPASAVANLRSHAAKLRQVVGDRLIARPNAYELRLAPEELDVTEFQRLVGEARTAAGPAAVIEKLTAALGYWRGAAAGDGLPRGTILDNRFASLDEQRLQVFEELAQARLTVGEHGALLPELRRHLAAHPLRERAWAQLMLALYRCGDVPAALGVYRDAHATLGEQLGIDPGEELAELHLAMLARSPDLAYAPPAASVTAATPAAEAMPTGTAGWVVPRELPADLFTYIGRTGEMADVVAGVTGAAPAAVAVAGPAGGGKTALAVRAAHAVAGDFPDGQIFVDLEYQPFLNSEDVLARALRALGVPATEVPVRACERVGRYRSLVAGRRLLLVVDGVTRAAQVRPLIPAGPGPALIVVGQRRLHSLDGTRQVTVTPMDAADGRAVLAALAGADRLDADPAATAQLLRLCSGSVLALRIAGSRLAGRPALPVAALIGQLGEGRGRLDWLSCEDLSMRASLATGVAAVRSGDEVAGRLLKLLADAPESTGLPDGAAAHLGVSTGRVWQALEELVDAHLVHRDEPGDYRLPSLVREYAAELVTVPHVPLHPLTSWRNDPVAA
jgi:DNA-binding SARP family transcriptional activator